MKTVNRDYFIAQIERKGTSMRQFAQMMGISHAQFSLSLGGGRKFKIEEAVFMSQYFGDPLHKVIEQMGIPVHTKGISISGILKGNGAVQMVQAPTEKAEYFVDIPKETVAIQCRTASSVFDWMDGWTLFCEKPTGIHPQSFGRFCLCKISGGDVVMGNVRRGYKEGTFNLSGITNKESVELEWSTPIITIRS